MADAAGGLLMPSRLETKRTEAHLGGDMKSQQLDREAAGFAPESDRSDTWTIGTHTREILDDDEECDLSPELRERVRAVHARLDCMKDCEILNVPADADWETLTAAYAAIIDDLHPGRHAGKALGAYGVKMETVVARATAAYHAIVKQRIRASSPPATPIATAEDDDQARREALAKKLASPASAPRLRTASVTPARMSSMPPPGASLPPPSMPPPRTSDNEARNDELEALLLRARVEELGFDWGSAAIHYERAYEMHPDPMTAARAARAIHRADGDLHKAAHLAEVAVQKQPRNAYFHVLLATIYREAGLLRRAASECERALDCDPNHARAKEMLAKVKSRI
jgi:hypothetical protein